MLSQALFSPSDFLIAGNPSALYTGYVVTDAPCVTAESPGKPNFSEYLAALDKKAESVNDPPPRDTESVAAVESGADEEEKAAAVESANAEKRYLAAFKSGGAARDDAEAEELTELTADISDADGLKNDGVAGVIDEAALGLVDAAPEANVEYSRQEANAAYAEGSEKAGKNGAAGELKIIPADSHGKAETTPKEAGSIKPLNVSDGIYIDKKTPEVEERLAGDTIAEEAEGETAAFSAKKSAAENTEGGNTTGLMPDDYADMTDVLARTPEQTKEKSGGARADSEKKPASERVRRNTAGARVDGGGAAQATQAGEAAPAREAVRVSAAPEAEITVNLRGAEPDGGGGSGSSGGAKPAASFESFLARELQQNLNGDIVRQAQVLLREGGEGTIRLSLKPESLGKVKIRLELAENKITGKIIVESGEALRAFEHEMDSLEQTFRGEGFDGANLSLELAGHEEPGSSESEWRPGGGKIATKTASSRYDGNAGKTGYFDSVYSAKQINVLV